MLYNEIINKVTQEIDVFLIDVPPSKMSEKYSDRDIKKTLTKYNLVFDSKATKNARVQEERPLYGVHGYEEGDRILDIEKYIVAVLDDGFILSILNENWIVGSNRGGFRTFPRYKFGPPKDSSIKDKIYYGKNIYRFEFTKLDGSNFGTSGNTELFTQRSLAKLEKCPFTHMNDLYKWVKKAKTGDIFTNAKYKFKCVEHQSVGITIQSANVK